jgi:hypothetical protein
MRESRYSKMRWLLWMVILLIVLWLAISLILAEAGYDFFRWS